MASKRFDFPAPFAPRIIETGPKSTEASRKVLKLFSFRRFIIDPLSRCSAAKCPAPGGRSPAAYFACCWYASSWSLSSGYADACSRRALYYADWGCWNGSSMLAGGIGRRTPKSTGIIQGRGRLQSGLSRQRLPIGAVPFRRAARDSAPWGEAAQPQAVTHHEHRAERHGRAGDHRVQQACRSQRQRRHVVGERPEEVSLDDPQRPA